MNTSADVPASVSKAVTRLPWSAPTPRRWVIIRRLSDIHACMMHSSQTFRNAPPDVGTTNPAERPLSLPPVYATFDPSGAIQPGRCEPADTHS